METIFSKKLVKEIQQLYSQEYKSNITDDEAQEYLNSYTDLFDIIINK